MKKFLLPISIICLLCLYSFAASTQISDREHADQTASRLLKILQSPHPTFSISSTVSSPLTPDDLKRAQLERPLSVFSIKEDQLAKYTAAEKPGTVLHFDRTYIYPISVNDQVRAMLSVSQQRSGQWGFDGETFDLTYLKDVLNAAKTLASDSSSKGQDILLIEDMFLALSLVGRAAGDDIKLIPIHDNNTFGLHAGVPVSARQFFLTLAGQTTQTTHDDRSRSVNGVHTPVK